jgi:NAD(P)-dependent dehydrogenase (short-subunit alcohol dehydrogenase family)
MEQSLNGKTVLVTGAGSRIGLGRAMAEALVSAGARVALMDLDAASIDQTAQDLLNLGGTDCVLPIAGDVRVAGDAEAAVSRTVEHFGGLHVLINNAGVNLPAMDGTSFWDVLPAAWERIIATNLNGAFFMAHAAVPHLRAQGWGRIIGITTSLDTMLRSAPYGPSKAGHEALVAVMARELEGSGVTANVLVPGRATLTGMTASNRDTAGLLKPEVMQAPAVWLASDQSAGFNGRRIIAELWDEGLPLEERLERASAPAGWPQLGRQRPQSGA